MKRYDKYKESSISWIGEIPEHWEEGAFGRYFSFGKGLSITKTDLQEEGIAVISYGQIHSKLNTGTSIKEELVRKVATDYLRTNSQSLLKLHDIVFADTSEDLEGVGNNAYNNYIEPLFAGYHTIIARPKGLPFPKYFAYLFQSRDWRKSVRSLVNGIKVYSVTKAILKKSFLLLPPLSEQETIVAYLEEKVAQMDNLVAKQEAQIAYLRELKQAIIAKAVTRGINPEVPLRPSGIPWIGDIPEHWEVKRLGRCFGENRLLNSDLECTEAYKFNYGSLIRKDENITPQELVDTYMKYTLLRENDIVINGLNLNYDFVSQRVAIAPQKGIITSAYLTLSPRKGINYNYYCLLFKAMDSMKLFHGMGAGIRLTLSYKDLKNQKLPLPPPSEQEAIVTYINRKTEKIDRLIAMTEQEIARVRELKQTLIADAVTGHINVQPS